LLSSGSWTGVWAGFESVLALGLEEESGVGGGVGAGSCGVVPGALVGTAVGAVGSGGVWGVDGEALDGELPEGAFAGCRLGSFVVVPELVPVLVEFGAVWVLGAGVAGEELAGAVCD